MMSLKRSGSIRAGSECGEGSGHATAAAAALPVILVMGSASWPEHRSASPETTPPLRILSAYVATHDRIDDEGPDAVGRRGRRVCLRRRLSRPRDERPL